MNPHLLHLYLFLTPHLKHEFKHVFLLLLFFFFKPDNILCSINPDRSMQIAIADFGLSRVFSVVGLMKTDCGTSHYAAPEVYKKELYGPSCDMWSLGVTVFAIVTGHFPFYKSGAKSLKAAILSGKYDENRLQSAGVSTMCRDFIDRLLVLDPAKRMTAEEALAHPWLRLTGPGADLSQSVESLRSSEDMFDAMSRDIEEDDDDDDGDVDM